MGNLSYVGIFLILCILGILYTIWASARSQKIPVQLRRVGIATQAEVVGLEFVPAVWNSDTIVIPAYYALTLRYCVEQPGKPAVPYIKTLSVGRHIGDNLEVGLYVPVVYLPSNPAESLLESDIKVQSTTGLLAYAKAFFMLTTAVALLTLKAI
jgi:hypothetical protein